MDFLSDGLCDGCKLSCLTVLDEYSRVCSSIERSTCINGRRVTAVLGCLSDVRGLPLSITVEVRISSRRGVAFAIVDNTRELRDDVPVNEASPSGRSCVAVSTQLDFMQLLIDRYCE
jgi:hypothetical protein